MCIKSFCIIRKVFAIYLHYIYNKHTSHFDLRKMYQLCITMLDIIWPYLIISNEFDIYVWHYYTNHLFRLDMYFYLSCLLKVAWDRTIDNIRRESWEAGVFPCHWFIEYQGFRAVYMSSLQRSRSSTIFKDRVASNGSHRHIWCSPWWTKIPSLCSWCPNIRTWTAVYSCTPNW